MNYFIIKLFYNVNNIILYYYLYTYIHTYIHTYIIYKINKNKYHYPMFYFIFFFLTNLLKLMHTRPTS